MNYYMIQPSAKLSGFVRYFWVLESDQPYTHHAMADVCPELLFHYQGRFDELLPGGRTESSFTAGIHGQTSQTRRFHINSSFGMLGVYLYPQTVPLLFGLPAAELTDQMPDLSTLLKAEGEVLEDAIWNAANNKQRISIIESFIEKRLAKNYKEQLPVFHSIQTIIQNKGLVKVKQLATDHFLSERQFERQFRQFSGFSPKLFSRIVRFQSAMEKYNHDVPSLTQLALECGYYDQSHFIHDFKAFSGHHPKNYFSGRSGATEWRD